MEHAVNLIDKARSLSELWSPRVIAQLNEMMFKVVHIRGDFVWHQHDDTDEAFLVIDGSMVIGFRERSVSLSAGDLFVIPKGVEHITKSEHGCRALIIEPAGVVNTGEEGGALTAPVDQWI
jgi:mannose-6-phosphate isomerase-like protein (cupin superfamily)